MVNSDVRRIVKATTEDLKRISKPYLGRMEYGNLRYLLGEDQFPTHYFGSKPYSWAFCFESMGNSSDKSSLWLAYDPDGGEWGRGVDFDTGGVERPYISRETGIRGLQQKIKGIPGKRLRMVEVHGWDTIDGMLVGEKLSDVYASWELRYRQHDHNHNLAILESSLVKS